MSPRRTGKANWQCAHVSTTFLLGGVVCIYRVSLSDVRGANRRHWKCITLANCILRSVVWMQWVSSAEYKLGQAGRVFLVSGVLLLEFWYTGILPHSWLYLLSMIALHVSVYNSALLCIVSLFILLKPHLGQMFYESCQPDSQDQRLCIPSEGYGAIAPPHFWGRAE